MSAHLDAFRRQHNEEIERLQHEYGDCTGEWRVVGTGPTRRVSCTQCGATYPAEPDNRRAAFNENYAGVCLKNLTAEGAALLKEDGR